MSFFSAKPIVFESMFDSKLERGIIQVVDDWPAVAVIDLGLLECARGQPMVVREGDKVYFSVSNGRAIYQLEPPSEDNLNVRTMTRIMGQIDEEEGEGEEE